MRSMNLLFGIIGTLLCASAVLGILFYILNAISYHTIAKNRGYDKPWLAWIPIANDYLKGAVADDINRRRGKASSFRVWLLVLSIVVNLSSIIIVALGVAFGFGTAFSSRFGSWLPDFFGHRGFYKSFSFSGPFSMFITLSPLISFLINAVAIAFAVVMFIVLYKTFEDYTPQNAVAFLLLSIFISVTCPFLLFSIRNKPAVSIYGGPSAAQGWNWAPPQQPYGTTPPPVYGQGNTVPPVAGGWQSSGNASPQPPQDNQDQQQQ